MSLTLTTATTQVRDFLNESTGTFWQDTEIQNWIKEGTKRFSAKTLMVEATDDIDPLVQNQLVYDSSDETWIGTIIEPYAALYDDGSNNYKGLIKVHPRQLGNIATFTAGSPKYYALHNRKLYIWPLTTALVASVSKITFLYAKVTEDITEVTDEFQHLPVIYACAKCKQKDQKFGEATALMTQFFTELGFEREDKHAREIDSLDKFKTPVRGGGTESARG